MCDRCELPQHCGTPATKRDYLRGARHRRAGDRRPAGTEMRGHCVFLLASVNMVSGPRTGGELPAKEGNEVVGTDAAD